MRRALLVAALATACTPNPRREMPAVVAAVAAFLARDGAGGRCIQRQIAPRTPAEADGGRTPPPPGFGDLERAGTFRGGGGVGGASVVGIAIGGSPGCVRLSGPVIDGDRAMMLVILAHGRSGYWLRKRPGGWAVVAATPAG